MKIGYIKSARKQIIYNYKNLYKLMRLAPKLLNCRVNMTFFVKNHKIVFSYFEEKRRADTMEAVARLAAHTLQHNLLLQFYYDP